jgi:hypothetical protein
MKSCKFMEQYGWVEDSALEGEDIEGIMGIEEEGGSNSF